MSHFAVVDTETTGLSPAYNHRIVEVAVVLLDSLGNEFDSWSTLVNPLRDVGATDIHGITAAHVFNAPRFEDIASHLINLLRGNILVAHNLPFDAGFLAAEFERIGTPAPLSSTLGLCTMSLAGRYLNASGRSLSACCDAIGHQIGRSHSALDDARASGKLLAHYLRVDASLHDELGGIIRQAGMMDWPSLPVGKAKSVSRAEAERAASQHFLSRLGSGIPREGACPETNSYFVLLDKVLMDRIVCRHEVEQLLSTARAIGLSHEEAIHCHHQYLSSLVQIASNDGCITQEKREHISHVARLLNLTSADVIQALSAPTETCKDLLKPPKKLQLVLGDAVVFTGERAGFDRAELESDAKRRGLRVTASVSRKTRVVIAGDPDSLSGKASKARDLGIPIVTFDYFESMVAHLEG